MTDTAVPAATLVCASGELEEQELDDVTLAQLDEEYATHPDEPQLEDEVQLREVWHQVE